MRHPYPLLLLVFFSFFLIRPLAAADPADEPSSENIPLVKQASPEETLAMLTSLVELQNNLKKQLAVIREKIGTTPSAAEKESLEAELSRLDRQLSDSSHDFERIATGVDVGLFAEKKQENFSWKDEMTTLIEPAIKEIKRLTVRVRQKTKLKDTISDLSSIQPVATNAVRQLDRLYKTTTDPDIKKQIKELLPEWQNVANRVRSKLELAELELSQMQDKEVSLVQSSSESIRNFFRVRGLYLAMAVIAFGSVLLLGRLLYRLIFRFLPGAKLEKRPFHIRLLDLSLRVFIVAAAIIGLFFVLYQAEDWFLLSMAIVFFLGLSWTVRQAVPRLWQQGRLMLNAGSVREGERLQLHDVPWKVETIHVFCSLFNPTLGVRLRLPIENIVGLVSRPYSPEEPWFPCKKGDWVVVGDSPRTRVVSLSHELVETVERGGKRYLFKTADFLSHNLVNLSRNFRVRVTFGVSYDLQAQVTTTIPALLKTFIEEKMEAEGYAGSCLNLLVEFKEAGASSLDLTVLADFKGDQAEIYSRLERAIQRWCVDAATAYNWEIPFPQLTFHWPARDRLLADGVPESSLTAPLPPG
ncbi:mechanosensitive ion channel [Desulfopila sp. IMCC35006]|uniref:mechanosensitive ion channel family protein n=1 Tax=Desulfopila sp. IMCC35006 TaxID=2569542 RepID=UPI0010AB71E2|nr:mechanosensitive ion channel family protein [Desulfopila sp. IMCC35006]TKB23858.1 mechanosensitive ion channel [Desulfopila sp. IMCC35006]